MNTSSQVLTLDFCFKDRHSFSSPLLNTSHHHFKAISVTTFSTCEATLLLTPKISLSKPHSFVSVDRTGSFFAKAPAEPMPKLAAVEQDIMQQGISVSLMAEMMSVLCQRALL